MASEQLIQLGDYIIIQRQKYTKLYKLLNANSTVVLGKDLIELGNIVNNKYYSTFKMIPLTGNNIKKSKHKPFILEPCSSLKDFKDEILQSRESGVDNRNILDDGRSQVLTSDEIEKLRETCTSSSEIVERLVENSKTFSSKTEYAQEKYLKKKEKKYFEYIQIKRPSIRILTDIFYRQDPEKVMGMRTDTLSQLVSYSGICSTGNYLMYESGTSGLLPALFLDVIGKNTDGKLVHLHPGNEPQKHAILALQFGQEQLDRCISVNIYSVLRQFFQSNNETEIAEEELVSNKKRKHSENNDLDDEHRNKILKNEENSTDSIEISDKNVKDILNNKVPAIPKWKHENDRACILLTEKLDGLTIIAKEHSSNILKTLLPFIKPSRPVVLYSSSREILMEMYADLKTSNLVTGLRLVTNWCRTYQILPMRTHPDVSMIGNSGFLLYGYTIEK